MDRAVENGEIIEIFLWLRDRSARPQPHTSPYN